MVLLWLLRARLGGLDGRRVGSSFMRIGAASIFMGAAAWATDRAVATWLPSHALPVLALRVAAAIGCAFVVLDVAARALRVEEFIEARALVLVRLKRLRGSS